MLSPWSGIRDPPARPSQWLVAPLLTRSAAHVVTPRCLAIQALLLVPFSCLGRCSHSLSWIFPRASEALHFRTHAPHSSIITSFFLLLSLGASYLFGFSDPSNTLMGVPVHSLWCSSFPVLSLGPPSVKIGLPLFLHLV